MRCSNTGQEYHNVYYWLFAVEKTTCQPYLVNYKVFLFFNVNYRFISFSRLAISNTKQGKQSLEKKIESNVTEMIC